MAAVELVKLISAGVEDDQKKTECGLAGPGRKDAREYYLALYAKCLKAVRGD